MNEDGSDDLNYKLITELACEESQQLRNNALRLPPELLGKKGACHILAFILQKLFASSDYVVVGVGWSDSSPPTPDHLGCSAKGWFIDIDGIRKLPEDARRCEPPNASNRNLRGYVFNPSFWNTAYSILDQYIRSNLSRYDIAGMSSTDD
jgi:hypothetical protein